MVRAAQFLIKDTLKEDKPPSKGQADSTHLHTLLKITSESYKMAKVSFIKRFHCTLNLTNHIMEQAPLEWKLKLTHYLQNYVNFCTQQLTTYNTELHYIHIY